MERFTLVCVISAAVTGLTSGVGVLPDSEIKEVGETMMFIPILDPTDAPFLSILWRFGDVSIIASAATNVTNEQYKDRITLFMSTGSLELRNLALSDNGTYSVTILTAGGAQKTGTTTLNVYEKVSKPNVTPTSTDLVENGTVTLSCSASGSPQSFLWFNDSVEVKANDRISFTNGGATVTIDPVLRYDQGNYSCKASNPISTSTSDLIFLTVSYGPEGLNLTAPPSDVYAEGSVVPLSCSADSRPAAHFSWFRNGEMLSNTGAQIDLVIKESGNYSCQAFNSKTQRYTTSQPVELTVFKKIVNSEIKPSRSPVVGSSVNLTCDATGTIVTREWTLNGTDLKPSGNIQFYHEKRVLSFKNLTSKDNGKYTCNISNPFSSQSADYIMKVTSGTSSGGGCSTGCIVGIVFGVIAVILIVAGVTFFILKKKKQKPKSSSRTDGEGQDNSTSAQNQEVQYADVRFVKKGGVVKGGAQNMPEYAEVRKNNRPAASRLPSYDAHMQRRPAPEPATLYADVRVK